MTTKKMTCLITRDEEGEPLVAVAPQDTDLASLQKLVGGYLEMVRINVPGAHAYVDEDGHMKGLPVNHTASALAGQTIVGPMVVLGDTGDGGEGDCPDTIYAALKSVGVG